MKHVILFTLSIWMIPAVVNAQYTIHSARQGFSMAVEMNNKGVFGRQAYNSGPPPCTFVGFEYPIGSTFEHLYGGGLWVGGLLDTSASGTFPPIKLMTTTYEGWSGPLYEMFPGQTAADTIWQVPLGSPEPPGWDQYWGSALPFAPFSDNDFHCRYTDDRIQVSQHIPLNIEVIQSSYVWDDPFAEGVQIIKYRIVNKGDRQIDSAYVGLFNEFGVNSVCTPVHNPWNHFEFYSNPPTVFFRNFAAGATPVGFTLISTSDTVSRIAFRWYPGPQSPASDETRYSLLSSGIIQPTEYPSGEPRILFGCGPFTIRPTSKPNPDTVEVVFAYVAGNDIPELLLHASRAHQIYMNGGPTSVRGGEGSLPGAFVLEQNYPNPFNPSTMIRYAIPTDEEVTIKVFDVMGREVATIMNEFRPAGSYSVRFDASDNSHGRGVSSGTYFYHIKAGSFSQVKRMLLLK